MEPLLIRDAAAYRSGYPDPEGMLASTCELCSLPESDCFHAISFEPNTALARESRPFTAEPFYEHPEWSGTEESFIPPAMVDPVPFQFPSFEDERRELLEASVQRLEENATTVQPATVQSHVEEIYTPGDRLQANIPIARRTHRRQAPRPRGHPCGFEGCGRTFDRSCDLNRHAKTHLRSNKCSFCNKGFLYPKDRDRHEQTHDGSATSQNQLFRCPFPGCLNPGFSRRDNLLRHQRKLHPFLSSPSNISTEGHETHVSKPQCLPHSPNAPITQYVAPGSHQSRSLTPFVVRELGVREEASDAKITPSKTTAKFTPWTDIVKAADDQKYAEKMEPSSRIMFPATDRPLATPNAETLRKPTRYKDNGLTPMEGVPSVLRKSSSVQVDPPTTPRGLLYRPATPDANLTNKTKIAEPMNQLIGVPGVEQPATRSGSNARPVEPGFNDRIVGLQEPKTLPMIRKDITKANHVPIEDYGLTQGVIPRVKRRTPINVVEGIEPQAKQPVAEQESGKVYKASMSGESNLITAVPLYADHMLDIAADKLKDELNSQTNQDVAKKELANVPQTSEVEEVGDAIVDPPSSDHTPDAEEIRQEKMAAKRISMGIVPQSPSQASRSLRFRTIFKLLELPGIMQSSLHQAVRTTQAAGVVLGFRESAITPDSRRIRWTCSCGRRLYDDFIELEPGALDDLQKMLAAEATVRRHANGNQGSSNRFLSRFSSVLSIFGSMPSIRRGTNGNTPIAGQLPTHNPPNTPASVATSIQSLCLLLCMKSGIFGTNVQYGQLRNIGCDRDLLGFLRTAYTERRSKLRRAISFRAVSSIKLIKFVADMNAHVDIHPHSTYCDKTDCICLPPKCKVEPEPNSEYACRPVPARHIPPVGENYMMHLYSSPECIHPSQVWVYNQIPKRTRGQLIAQPDAPAEGWGLQFQEGPHWRKIMTTILTLFVGGSLIFGLLYALLQKDAQTAFTIATWWFSAAGILIGYLAATNP